MTAYAGTFETEEKARAAVQNLVDNPVSSEPVLLLVQGASIEETMKTARGYDYLPGIEARVMAAVEAGRSVVLVKAPYGWATRTVSALQTAGAESVLNGESEPPTTVFEYLGLPAVYAYESATQLITEDTTPLSSFFGLPLLSERKHPFNRSLGLPLLTSSETPLSSLFRIPLLSRGR